MTESSGRVALIAGITGQDGAYLARFFLGKGYIVHGTSRMEKGPCAIVCHQGNVLFAFALCRTLIHTGEGVDPKFIDRREVRSTNASGGREGSMPSQHVPAPSFPSLPQKENNLLYELRCQDSPSR